MVLGVPIFKHIRAALEGVSHLITINAISWARSYKTFFILNSVEHEILNAHKFKNIKTFGLFSSQITIECYFFRS